MLDDEGDITSFLEERAVEVISIDYLWKGRRRIACESDSLSAANIFVCGILDALGKGRG